MDETSGISNFRCWQALDRVVAGATFAASIGALSNVNKDGWATVKVKDFEVCGISRDIAAFLYGKAVKPQREILETYHQIKFTNNKQLYDRKELELKVTGSNRSVVPDSWLHPDLPSSSATAEGKTRPSGSDQHNVLVPIDTPLHTTAAVEANVAADVNIPAIKVNENDLAQHVVRLHDLACAETLVRSVTPPSAYEKDKCQRYYANDIKPHINGILDTMVTKAENKYNKSAAYEFAIDVIGKTVRTVQSVGEAAIASTAATDKAIVDSMGSVLQQFQAKGSRSGDEQNATKIMLTSVSGAIVNKQITQAQACDRRGIRWQATWTKARSLYEDLVGEDVDHSG